MRFALEITLYLANHRDHRQMLLSAVTIIFSCSFIEFVENARVSNAPRLSYIRMYFINRLQYTCRIGWMIELWTHAQRSCVFNFEGVESVFRILH